MGTTELLKGYWEEYQSYISTPFVHKTSIHPAAPEHAEAVPEALFVVMRKATYAAVTPFSTSCLSFVALLVFHCMRFQSSERKGTEKPELILNVQMAFQRCQHMTAIVIAKMHLPPLSCMTKPSPACSEGSPFSTWLSQVAVQSAAALLGLLTEPSLFTSDSHIFMLAE